MEETVHSLMPYRNQAEVMDRRLSQLYQYIDVSIAVAFLRYVGMLVLGLSDQGLGLISLRLGFSHRGFDFARTRFTFLF